MNRTHYRTLSKRRDWLVARISKEQPPHLLTYDRQERAALDSVLRYFGPVYGEGVVTTPITNLLGENHD